MKQKKRGRCVSNSFTPKQIHGIVEMFRRVSKGPMANAYMGIDGVRDVQEKFLRMAEKIPVEEKKPNGKVPKARRSEETRAE